MAFRTQKISQMTPKGSDLEATDLIEVSTIESGSYVTRSITGQELIDAIPLPPSGITIGTTAITSGTVGRVLFEGTGNVVQESSSLFWDSTNDRLTIGTSTGTSKINLPDAGTTASDGIAFGNGANIFKNASSGISLFSGSGTWQFNSAILVLPTNQATFIRMAAGRNLLIDNGTTTFASINGTTGNVLINTTTDAGFRLDVNGTARVTSSLRVESSFTALSAATIGGTTLAANAILQVNGSGKYVNYNSSFSSGSFLTYQAFGTWEAIGADSPAGTILAFGGYRASQWTGITLHSNGSERMRIHSTGNIGINTTTDAGFKLDVNGTARVSGNTTIVGNITQSGANTTNLGYITNATLGVYGNTPAASTIGLLVGCVTNGGHTAIFTKGNNSGSTAIRITDQNVGASINHFLVDFAGASGFGIANGTTVVNSSAQVEIQSTTKGFLPPRMTTTQKNAIATPATGLQIYDSTLNRPCFYDGTTWITL